MSAQSDSERSKGAEEEEGGGLLPAIVVGAGILVVAALLIFDFGDDEETQGDKSANAARAGEAEGGGGGAGANKGGVQSRPYDPAEGPKSRLNPAIKLPNVGMAPAPPPTPEEPPEFSNTAEEIAWYEKKLAGAIRIRDARKKFVERLPKVKERIEAGPNPEEGLASFEGRKKIVEDNYASAQKDVEEIEAKLAELRG